ncbi:MAG TPA: DUF192 domain-containing protein [Thermomicrobiales bacterium]|nr:DUF192 domain-containing protein [Thermomicrobiales bacterium]
MRTTKWIVTVFMMVLIVSAPLVVVAQGAGEDVTLPPWRRELPGGRRTAQIIVGDTPLTVDLAITPAEQTLGLGYRNGLEPGTGMLFVGSDARPRTFWMKGMRFCLDIIWIEDNQIAGAAQDACPDPPGTADSAREVFASPGPVSYVLEVPAGWMAEHGYEAGTPVDLHP